MAGKARIQVFGPQAEGHTGPDKASVGDSVVSNEPNLLRLWAKNAGGAGNKANFPGLLGGEALR